MIVALVNLKGGVGKTTSALYFAAVSEERGEDPVVLDADNERSAVEWARAGKLPFEVLEAQRDGLARQARPGEGGPHRDNRRAAELQGGTLGRRSRGG